MPIYEYRCSSCGSRKEHLQKISDPRLTACPACGKETYEKQLTAAGFQLKGSGWYVTDFRNNTASSPAKAADGKDTASKDAGTGEAAKESAPKEGASKDGAAKESTSSDSSSAGSAAATAAPASSSPTSTGS